MNEGVPDAWGDWERRSLNWELVTANALLEAGADILVLRHPEAVTITQDVITTLMKGMV